MTMTLPPRIWVGALAAGLVLAGCSANGLEHGAHLTHPHPPHAERPIADVSRLSTRPPVTLDRTFQVFEFLTAKRDAELADFYAAVQRQTYLAALARAHQGAVRALAGPSAPSAPRTRSSGSDSAFLACTRAHESDTAGGYVAVSPGGRYRGAYQFDQSTWNSTASTNGRPDLVGRDPAGVAPSDQDAMATDLYHARGNQPWGGRC